MRNDVIFVLYDVTRILDLILCHNNKVYEFLLVMMSLSLSSQHSLQVKPHSEMSLRTPETYIASASGSASLMIREMLTVLLSTMHRIEIG